MHRHGHIAALLGAALLAACGDKVDRTVTGPAPSAQVKFFNFGVNSPQVNFFIDTTKATAISSATGSESSIGTAYGAAAAGGLYVNITPGPHDLSGRISAAGADKNRVISTVNRAIEAGKSYSYFQSGFYNTTTKQVDAFVIEDPYVIPKDTMVRVRFVNAISNAPAQRLIVKSQAEGAAEAVIGGDVAYKSATDFQAIPPGVYDLYVRNSGSTTNAFTRTGVSFVRFHVYTITSRGDITVTSTTATNRPQLDVTANY